jgi:hypothetical protein
MVPVEFILGHRCEFGQRFALLGGDDALGAWDAARARPLVVRPPPPPPGGGAASTPAGLEFF